MTIHPIVIGPFAQYPLRWGSVVDVVMCWEKKASILWHKKLSFLSLQPVSWASRPTSPSSCPTLCWASDAAPTSWTTFLSASPGSLERRWGHIRGLYYQHTSQHSCRNTPRLHSLTAYLREGSESCSRQRKWSRCAAKPKLYKPFNPLDANCIKILVSWKVSCIIPLTCLIKSFPSSLTCPECVWHAWLRHFIFMQ